MLVDRLDLVQNKLNEQERKVLNLTKLVELNSNIESTSISHKLKQDLTKIDSMIEKKLAESSKNIMNSIESKFESHADKLQLISTVNGTNTSKNELDEFRTIIRKDLSKNENSLKTDFLNKFDDLDTKITATKKATETRLRDIEAMCNDKIKLLELKILDSNSERS